MPQSLSMNLVHLIYSTKHRDASLTPAIRSKLYAYQAGILQEWNSPAIVIGGVFDHVHALFVLSNHALCKVVEEVKKGSSKWIKTQGAAFTPGKPSASLSMLPSPFQRACALRVKPVETG